MIYEEKEYQGFAYAEDIDFAKLVLHRKLNPDEGFNRLNFLYLIALRQGFLTAYSNDINLIHTKHNFVSNKFIYVYNRSLAIQEMFKRNDLAQIYKKI